MTSQKTRFPAIQPGGSLILAWQVKGKHVLVVGGGEVAAGRILHCLNADAVVTVVCPASGLNPEVSFRVTEGQVKHVPRTFEPSDLDNADMVLVAIDDPAASTAIWKLAKERRIPANIADVPPECDFYFGSVHRDGPLQIMVSTNGKGPRLAALIRKFIAKQLPRNAGNAIESIGNLRIKLRAVAPNAEESPKRMSWMTKVSDTYSWEEMCQLTEDDMDCLLRYYPENKVPSFDELRQAQGLGNEQKTDLFDETATDHGERQRGKGKEDNAPGSPSDGGSESDGSVEEEPFGTGAHVIHDDEIEPPLSGLHRMIWEPFGSYTDPLMYAPGPDRPWALPDPSRGDHLGSFLSPEFGTRWPRPDHLWTQTSDGLDFNMPMYGNESAPEDTAAHHVGMDLTRTMTNAICGYHALVDKLRGKHMSLDAIANALSKKPAGKPTGDIKTALHEVLNRAYIAATASHSILGKLSSEKGYNIPTHPASDLHHFESEYDRLDDKAAWPGSAPVLQSQAKIRLKHARLAKKAEARLVADMGRIEERRSNLPKPGPHGFGGKPSTPAQPLSLPPDAEMQLVYDRWAKSVAHLYLAPHINLSELEDPLNLLMFLGQRGWNTMETFFDRDFSFSHLGRALRILTVPSNLLLVSISFQRETAHPEALAAHEKGMMPTGSDGELHPLASGAPYNPFPRIQPYIPTHAPSWYGSEIGGDTRHYPLGDAWLAFKIQEFMYRFANCLSDELFKAQQPAEVSNSPDASNGNSDWQEDADDAFDALLDRYNDNAENCSLLETVYNHPAALSASELHYAENQLGLAPLILYPGTFHTRLQQEYDHHYSHLLPGLISGEDMQKELFVDLVRNVFRRPFIDSFILRQFSKDIKSFRALSDPNPQERENSGGYAGPKWPNTKAAGLGVIALRHLWSARVEFSVRGMVFCAYYLASMVKKCLAASTEQMRKYYRAESKLKPGPGAKAWVSKSKVVRYLPKRGGDGKIMKRTRRLRRATCTFPHLGLQLTEEGAAAIKQDATLNSLHILLVEVMQSEDLVNAVTLIKVIRRIEGLHKSIDPRDERYRVIRGPLAMFVYNASLLLAPMEDIYMEGHPLRQRPASTSPHHHSHMERYRRDLIEAYWNRDIKLLTGPRLKKLDEFPIEKRVPDEIITALYKQHKAWVARRSSGEDPNANADADARRQTGLLLRHLWKAISEWMLSERAIGDGIVEPGDPPERPAKGYADLLWDFAESTFSAGDTEKSLGQDELENVNADLLAALRQSDNAHLREQLHDLSQQTYYELFPRFHKTVCKNKSEIPLALRSRFRTIARKLELMDDAYEKRMEQAREDADAYIAGAAKVTPLMPELLLEKRDLWVRLLPPEGEELPAALSKLAAQDQAPGAAAEEELEVPAVVGSEDVELGGDAQMAEDVDMDEDVGVDEGVGADDDTEMRDVQDDDLDVGILPEWLRERYSEGNPESWWMDSLDVSHWDELSKEYEGYVHPVQETRWVKHEIPPDVRARYVEKLKPQPAPRDQQTGKGILKRSAMKTLNMLLPEGPGPSTEGGTVTMDDLKNFMRAIGFRSSYEGGSMVRFTFCQADSYLQQPQAEAEEEAASGTGDKRPQTMRRKAKSEGFKSFVVHAPHGSGSSSRVLSTRKIGRIRDMLVGAGLTREHILRYYTPRSELET